jgi:hypothetical protein
MGIFFEGGGWPYGQDAVFIKTVSTLVHRGFESLFLPQDSLGKDDEDGGEPYWRFSFCWIPLIT